MLVFIPAAQSQEINMLIKQFCLEAFNKEIVKNKEEVHNLLKIMLDMTVTNESGGRLNAFANEPRIDVISSGTSNDSLSQIFLILFSLAIICIIGILVIFK